MFRESDLMPSVYSITAISSPVPESCFLDSSKLPFQPCRPQVLEGLKADRSTEQAASEYEKLYNALKQSHGEISHTSHSPRIRHSPPSSHPGQLCQSLQPHKASCLMDTNMPVVISPTDMLRSGLTAITFYDKYWLQLQSERTPSLYLQRRSGACSSSLRRRRFYGQRILLSGSLRGNI